MLKNKVAIVTGAAHPMGIGFSVCRKLADAGAKVVITDVVENKNASDNLNARASEITDSGGEALAVAVDVTDGEQIDACLKQIRNVFGRVDILFNNAGSPVGVGDFMTITDGQWDVSYQVNIKGTVDMCRAVLPDMIALGGGTIINNASIAGLGAVPRMAAYTATKFAVVGLTKALAAEFGPLNVRVNAVCPGLVWTQMGQQEVKLNQRKDETPEAARTRLAAPESVPLCRWASAGEVADAVAYLASDAASYISGVALPVAGGMASGL